jgi:hypothetical protein
VERARQRVSCGLGGVGVEVWPDKVSAGGRTRGRVRHAREGAVGARRGGGGGAAAAGAGAKFWPGRSTRCEAVTTVILGETAKRRGRASGQPPMGRCGGPPSGP